MFYFWPLPLKKKQTQNAYKFKLNMLCHSVDPHVMINQIEFTNFSISCYLLNRVIIKCYNKTFHKARYYTTNGYHDLTIGQVFLANDTVIDSNLSVKTTEGNKQCPQYTDGLYTQVQHYVDCFEGCRFCGLQKQGVFIYRWSTKKA